MDEVRCVCPECAECGCGGRWETHRHHRSLWNVEQSAKLSRENSPWNSWAAIVNTPVVGWEL